MASSAVTPPKQAGPLAMMERLSPIVFLYRPPTTTTATPSEIAGGPKLILLASWMGARDAHIAKYVARHQALFPAAQILLVKCEQAHVWLPAKARREVAAAVPALRAALLTSSSLSSSAAPTAGPYPPERSEETKKRPELLVHLFSNGGSGMVAHLYDAYAAQVADDGYASEQPAQLLPPHVTLFDSAPGRFSFRRGWTATTVGLRPLAKLLAAPLLAAVLAFYWVLFSALGRRDLDPLARWGDAHNDPARNGAELRRAYVYSEADALVDWRWVESHAAEARARGFAVRLEKFAGSPHVAHARADEGRYWRIVRDLWEGNGWP